MLFTYYVKVCVLAKDIPNKKLRDTQTDYTESL